MSTAFVGTSPPHDGSNAAANPPPLGAAYDAVLASAQTGTDWAWTALYRSVARPLLNFLEAAGDAHPADTLGEVVVEAARGVRTFGGDEATLRVWLFTIAYRRLAAQRRPVRVSSDAPSADQRRVVGVLRGLGVLGERDVAMIVGLPVKVVQDIPRVPVAANRAGASSPPPTTVTMDLEQRHIAGAARAAVTGSTAPEAAPPAFRQLRPARGFVRGCARIRVQY